MTMIRRIGAALVLALGIAASLSAQVPGVELTHATRAALDSLLIRLDQASQSPVYSAEVRARVRRQADLVRARLADGDFQVGDRVLLTVEGETALTDTFTVQSGRQLILPNVPNIPLGGVLRAELTDHLRRVLTQSLRDPKVRAQVLIRLTVRGSVVNQGFYTLPVDITLPDVLQAAGGPDGTADLQRISVRRGDETLWSPEEVVQLITEGRTLDAINIQAGDVFVVPAQRVRNPYQTMQVLIGLLTIPFTVISIIALFK